MRTHRVNASLRALQWSRVRVWGLGVLARGLGFGSPWVSSTGHGERASLHFLGESKVYNLEELFIHLAVVLGIPFLSPGQCSQFLPKKEPVLVSLESGVSVSELPSLRT